ncbi:hypothetical protein U9M48_012781 [Paspalum notatum var. saurae]|uniref:CCHC-type domain-containing protein n=1 Tax=Paspalum notatum var. saurae TaxID=547442 RepID=A0AAQ3T0E3_PASNO
MGDKTPPQSPGSKGGDKKIGDDDASSSRTVRDVGVPANWPVLTKTNYTEWALLMRIKMKARNLWDAVEAFSPNSQFGFCHWSWWISIRGIRSLWKNCNGTSEQEMMALDAITIAIPVDMVTQLAVKETAKEAWDAIKSMRVSSDQARKSKAQRLRREFETIRFKPDESINDFTARISNLAATMETVGDKVEPRHVMEKMLRIAPKKFRKVAVAVAITADLTKLTLEDLSVRLHAVEGRIAEEDEPPPPRADGKLYLTAEQWEERTRGRSNSGDGSSSTKVGDDRRRKPRRKSGGRGGRKDNEGSTSSGKDAPPRDNSCQNCGKKGHWAMECHAKERANLTQDEDEEDAALLLTIASVDSAPICPEPEDKLVTPTQGLHVNEPRASAFLAADDEEEPFKGWYIDTGASNHMTSRGNVFAELDRDIKGTVKFGNGSIADIQGIGTVVFFGDGSGISTVVFSGKHGKHKALRGVYFIPRLKNSIINVGQLVEGGSRIEVEDGLLHIWDRERQLLARVERRKNKLYVLHLQATRPAALLA